MSHQRIRFATILSDLLLFNGGFALAYVIRYKWQWLRPITFLEPFSDYLGQLLLLDILLQAGECPEGARVNGMMV